MLDRLTKYLIFVLLIVYSLQGFAYESETMFAKYILLGIMLIGSLYFMKSFLYFRRNGFVTLLLLFVIIHVIYYLLGDKIVQLNYLNAVIDVDIDEIAIWSILKNIFFLCFLFFVAFNLSVSGRMNDKNMIAFFIVFTAINIWNFIFIEQDLEDETTINLGYSFVHLMPFVFLIKRRWLFSFGYLLFCLFVVLTSAKRGAIVIASLFVLYYMAIFYKSTDALKYKKNIVLVLILCCLIIVAYRVFNSSEYLLERYEQTVEGNTSGRDVLYADLLLYWLDSDHIVNYVFGYGLGASLTIVGLFAHNDWLELLTSMGLMGCILYMFMFIAIWKDAKTVDLDGRYRHVLFSILIVWFVKTLFSMGYTDMSMYPIFILLGYVTGKVYLKQREQKMLG